MKTHLNRRKKAILKGFHRATGVGAIPGTITQMASDSACRITQLKYSPEEVVEELLPDYLAIRAPRDSSSITWLMIEGQPGSNTLDRLSTEFGIHPLALEDVVNTHQRCKAEDYDTYLFVVARMPAIGKTAIWPQSRSASSSARASSFPLRKAITRSARSEIDF